MPAVTRRRSYRHPSVETPQPGTVGIFSTAEYEARERTVQARARSAEARARSAEAKAGRDQAPASSGPGGRPRPLTPAPVSRARSAVSSRARSGGRRTLRVLRRTAPRRALLTEFVAMCVIIGVSEVARTKQPPAAGVFLPPVVVFLVLGMVADFSPGSAKLAVAFGGLVLLTVALTHSQGIIDGLKAVQGAGAPAYAVGGGGSAQGR